MVEPQITTLHSGPMSHINSLLEEEAKTAYLINENNSVLAMKIQHSDSSFSEKLTRSIKKKLIDLLPSLKMNESKKSYLLHLATTAWEIRELVEVVNEINITQSTDQDLILLKETEHGFLWNKAPFFASSGN